MTADIAPRQASAPDEGPDGFASEPAELLDAPARPHQARILAIVAARSDCLPLTDAEINEAAQRHDRAATLLAAAAIAHCQAAEDEDPTVLLHAYLSYEIATQRLGGSGGVKLTGREIARNQTWAKDLRQRHESRAEAFAGIVRGVAELATDYESEFVTDGKINRAALGDLLDATDDIDHPILRALPPITTVRGDERQAAVITADRLIRYILLRAQSTDQAQPAESV